MNFQKILKQVAAENNTTPEDVYREMQIALEDAYSHKDDTQESQALADSFRLKSDINIYQQIQTFLAKVSPSSLRPR